MRIRRFTEGNKMANHLVTMVDEAGFGNCYIDRSIGLIWDADTKRELIRVNPWDPEQVKMLEMIYELVSSVEWVATVAHMVDLKQRRIDHLRDKLSRVRSITMED